MVYSNYRSNRLRFRKNSFVRRPMRGRRSGKTKPKNSSRYNKPNKSFIKSPYMSDEVFLKLVYTTNVSVASVAGVPQFYTFAGNSLYDPDITGTGHQPMGFDQWQGFYNKYTVYGSKIRATFCNVDSVAGAPNTENIMVGLVPTPSDVAIASIAAANDIVACAEYPYGKYKAGNIVNAAPQLTLNSYMSSSKIDGIPKAKVAIDDRYTAVVSANPVNMWRWNIGLQATDKSSTCGGRLLVKITYYCRLSARQIPSQS